MKRSICILIFLILLINSCDRDNETNSDKKISFDNIIIEKKLLNFSPKKLDFLDKNIGYVIDNTNKILKTTDGGNSWNEVYQSTFEIIDIQFITEAKGFLLGKNGNVFLLFTTNNGGQTFQENTINSGFDLTKIFFLDSNLGFALGKEIKRTQDGGISWSAVNTSFNVFNDIIKYNNQLYVSGLNGFFSKSNDDGINWSTININSDSHIYSIIPIENSFYLIGQKIIYTNLTTTKQNLMPANFTGSHVFDKNIIIGFGESYPTAGYYARATLYLSNNYGKNWETKISNDFNRYSSIDFINRNQGFGIAKDFYNGKTFLINIQIK